MRIRRIRLRGIGVVLGVAIVTAVQSAAAQPTRPPSVGGFSLGNLWAGATRAYACRYGGVDSIGRWSSQATGVRWCEASDSVTLYYLNDTLASVRMVVRLKADSVTRFAPGQWQRISTAMVATFGEPDSVIVRGSDNGRHSDKETVIAQWKPGITRGWTASVEVSLNPTLPSLPVGAGGAIATITLSSCGRTVATCFPRRP